MRKKLITDSGLALFGFLISIVGDSQEKFAEFLVRDSFVYKLEYLKTEFGINKTIPKEIELECLTALSYYPELKNSKIIFQFNSSTSMMVSRPKLKSFSRSGNKREYSIIMCKSGTSKSGFDLSELNFNSLIGWIAHELGHIVHYTYKTSGGVLFMGLKYAFPDYRRRLERFTDNVVIQHDLGYALFEGTDYCINYSNAKPHFKKYMEKYYLSPFEIKEAINNKSFYKIAYNKTRTIKQDQYSSKKG